MSFHLLKLNNKDYLVKKIAKAPNNDYCIILFKELPPSLVLDGYIDGYIDVNIVDKLKMSKSFLLQWFNNRYHNRYFRFCKNSRLKPTDQTFYWGEHHEIKSGL